MNAAAGRTRKRSGRQLPVVFGIAGALLLIAVVAGQVWQRQPAGPLTYALLASVAHHCSSAAFVGRHPTVGDGAVALDRATLRLLADRLPSRPAPAFGWVRCK